MPDRDMSTRKTEEILSMLREINGSSSVTQRELSARLGISLGKVNFLLRALIEKGLVRVSNFKKSKCNSEGGAVSKISILHPKLPLSVNP